MGGDEAAAQLILLERVVRYRITHPFSLCDIIIIIIAHGLLLLLPANLTNLYMCIRMYVHLSVQPECSNPSRQGMKTDYR